MCFAIILFTCACLEVSRKGVDSHTFCVQRWNNHFIKRHAIAHKECLCMELFHFMKTCELSSLLCVCMNLFFINCMQIYTFFLILPTFFFIFTDCFILLDVVVYIFFYIDSLG